MIPNTDTGYFVLLSSSDVHYILFCFVFQPDLLSWSAGRSLISDYDIVDLNNATGKKGSPLVLFFFTDVLLVSC
jgi:hypothetical protein